MIIKKIKISEIKGTLYFVGDLHGMYHELMKTLKNISFNFEKDLLICVGDLIDRGPCSLECLRLINEPWFITVKGNHEEMMYDALFNDCQPSMDTWQRHGGTWYFKLNDLQKEEANSLIKQLYNDHPYAILIDQRILVVHAEFYHSPDSIQLKRNEAQIIRMIWGRDRIKKGHAFLVPNVDMVVVGHTPVVPPYVLGNTIYIDNGGCFSWNSPFVISELELYRALENN